MDRYPTKVKNMHKGLYSSMRVCVYVSVLVSVGYCVGL